MPKVRCWEVEEVYYGFNTTDDFAHGLLYILMKTEATIQGDTE